MNSPRTLVLSIAATACGFLLALVGIIGQASTTATPMDVAMIPGIVSTIAQDVNSFEPVPYVVALESATSHVQGR
jgi:hypothetical protein